MIIQELDRLLMLVPSRFLGAIELRADLLEVRPAAANLDHCCGF